MEITLSIPGFIYYIFAAWLTIHAIWSALDIYKAYLEWRLEKAKKRRKPLDLRGSVRDKVNITIEDKDEVINRILKEKPTLFEKQPTD